MPHCSKQSVGLEGCSQMKIGLVGFGFMGQVHYKAYDRLPDVEVVAVVEPGPNAQMVPEGVPVFDDVKDMFSTLAIDIVDICLPTHMHASCIQDACMWGKHVICEKPLARTVEEARQVIDDCEQAGVELYVAHVLRFFPEYRTIRQAIVDGEIGRPRVVEARRLSSLPLQSVDNWLHNHTMSGGAILDLAIHEFDFLRWILGEVDTVFCQSIHNRVRHEICVATLKFASGAVALVEAGWGLPEGSPFTTSIDIAGTDGLLTYDSNKSQPVALLLPYDMGYKLAPSVEPYVAELSHFIRCMKGEEQPICTAHDGLEAVKIASAAIKSAESGRAERLVSE